MVHMIEVKITGFCLLLTVIVTTPIFVIVLFGLYLKLMSPL